MKHQTGHTKAHKHHNISPTKPCCAKYVVIYSHYIIRSWGTMHQQFFHLNSNSMAITFCSHPNCNKVSAMKFCTWHDSCAVVPCAKFYSHMIPYNRVTLKHEILHQIWITIEKSFGKWAPGCVIHFQKSVGEVIFLEIPTLIPLYITLCILLAQSGWDKIATRHFQFNFLEWKL